MSQSSGYNPDKIRAYAVLLTESFQRWTGRPILAEARAPGSARDVAEALFEAACPLVSHGTEADPVFRYANHAALALWETDWDAFTRMPSRLSAAPEAGIQTDRQDALKAALEKGCIENYSGARVSTTGKKFTIENTILWNVTSPDGALHGQAALIRSWKPG